MYLNMKTWSSTGTAPCGSTIILYTMTTLEADGVSLVNLDAGVTCIYAKRGMNRSKAPASEVHDALVDHLSPPAPEVGSVVNVTALQERAASEATEFLRSIGFEVTVIRR